MKLTILLYVYWPLMVFCDFPKDTYCQFSVEMIAFSYLFLDLYIFYILVFMYLADICSLPVTYYFYYCKWCLSVHSKRLVLTCTYLCLLGSTGWWLSV